MKEKLTQISKEIQEQTDFNKRLQEMGVQFWNTSVHETSNKVKIVKVKKVKK